MTKQVNISFDATLDIAIEDGQIVGRASQGRPFGAWSHGLPVPSMEDIRMAVSKECGDTLMIELDDSHHADSPAFRFTGN